MALSGPVRPHLAYTNSPGAGGSGAEVEAETLAKALELARQIEELLEDTRSMLGPSALPEDPRTHSTRMARAMAASLVDELDALVRPSRRTGSS
ncbi:MAG: hypothetical protein NVS3B10_17970 [Polyangiales bacterium]